MIKIGLDISTTSSGICINEGNSYKFFNITDKSTKYHKNSKNITSYIVDKAEKGENYRDKADCNKQYTENELNKLKKYKQIESKLEFILSKYSGCEMLINIEGYSYSSQAGNLIDIVTLSTILRLKCLEYSDNVMFTAPQSLKKQVLDNCYKKEKSDMIDHFLEVFDEDDICIYNEIKEVKALKLKTIPKPIDDCIDAFWLCYII